MPADQGAIDAASTVNAKVGMEGPATALSILQQEAVAAWTAMNQLRHAATAKATENILSAGAEEAVAVQKILSGNDLAQQLAALANTVAQIQQTMKGAQTTQPETGGKPE